MIKLLIGGSPCTHWSIAQKNNRETKPEGEGWELFLNYLIAKEKFKPDFFLYENNKSAAPPIKDEIKKRLEVYDGTLFMEDKGARYIEINSALVSAQNRQRFYVHNCGEVDQPEDRGIILGNIIEKSLEAEPIAVASRGRYVENGNVEQFLEARPDKKTNALTTVQKDNLIAEPVNPLSSGKSRTITAGYANKGIKHILESNYSDNPAKQKFDSIAEPVCVGHMPQKNGEISKHKSKQYRVYSENGKSTTLCGNGGGLGAKTGLYALPINEDVNGKSRVIKAQYGKTGIVNLLNDNKKGGKYSATGIAVATENNDTRDSAKKAYEVKNGYITIKGKRYPIKLPDGNYHIRKLTPVECERLQTLPDNYTAAVSNTQRYRGLGNGWTAEVIIHILKGALKDVPRDEEIVVLSMYDGIGTGRYCLDKMGFTNITYYAYEIDKYAIQVAMSNYPDIIQCGDAFAIRDEKWSLKCL